MFKDENGLPVTLQGDGGDSLQRSGAWAAAMMSRCCKKQCVEFSQHALGFLHIGRGLWIRHPDKLGAAAFWSDPKWTSRDQLLNAFVIARFSKNWRVLAMTTLRLIIRVGFSQNWKDHFAAQMSLVVRVWFPFSIIFWPLLLILDLGLAIGVFFDCMPFRWKHETKSFIRRTGDDADVDNAVLQHFIAWLWMPTPISFLARIAHARFMGKTFGTTKFGMPNRLCGALLWKHRSEAPAFGDPMLAVLWTAWLEEFT